ncbi:hypothetical protein E2P81_ATG05019 [Venturia nashicola]|nr:hypothetical protein E2P81_ATG05019 [Venturia nashicola]
MSTTQIHSFLPYERGLSPRDIRIGSLFLNIFNIEESKERERFEYRQDLTSQSEYEKAIEPWSTEPQIDSRGYGINFELSKETSMNVKFSEWIKAEGGVDGKITATLEGDSGRRLRIKKTDSFLENSVMKQPGIDKWIRTQASISRKAFFGHQFKAPKIWLCTGVQLVTNGDVHTGSSRSTRAAVGGGVDAGAIAGGPPGVLVAQAEGGHACGAEAGNHFGYEGERVWAAQFMEVSFEFSSAPDPKDKEHPKTIANFQLEDIADLKARGLRAGQDVRMQADGQSMRPPPPLVARITVAEEKEGVVETWGIKIDDHPYVKSMEGTDWASYNECLKFLADADTSERVITV